MICWCHPCSLQMTYGHSVFYWQQVEDIKSDGESRTFWMTEVCQDDVFTKCQRTDWLQSPISVKFWFVASVVPDQEHNAL
jgi:hypothetical protein